mmetsp:Transcript_11784/g.21451  ORF Transcript_11784/g.21451 Transcript_11784/m.21451 type:complete len:218 (+) Transcript_11784:27-680(+)
MANSQRDQGLAVSLQYFVSTVASHHAEQAASSSIKYALPPSSLGALSTLVYGYSTTLLPTEMSRVAKHRSGARARVFVGDQDVRFMVRKVPKESRDGVTDEERESGDLWSWEDVRNEALEHSKEKTKKRRAKKQPMPREAEKARKTDRVNKSNDFGSSDGESDSALGRKHSNDNDNDSEINDTTTTTTAAMPRGTEVISLLEDGSNSSSSDEDNEYL